MSDNTCDVLLVTSDSALRAAVDKSRPANAKLLVRAPGQCSEALPRARQHWLDVDGVSGNVDLGPCSRRVYFHSDRPPPMADAPPGVFVRKLPNRTVLRILWANVGEPLGASNTAPVPESVPGWLLELHELELRTLCQRIVSIVPQRLGYGPAALYLRDETGRNLTLGESNCDFAIDLLVPLSPASGHAFAKASQFDMFRAPAGLAAASALHHWQVPALPLALLQAPALLLPLRTEDATVGLLCLFGGAERPEAGTNRTSDSAPEPSAVAEDSTRSLRVIAAFLARALHHARCFERARTEARVDGLTGLFNYRWLCESLDKEIHRAERYGSPFSILVVDLDEFKPLNDVFGHVAGDAILRHVAARISAVLRQTDSAARIGGDEFVVLLPATDAAGAAHAAERIGGSIRDNDPLVGDRHVPIRVSIGAATWLPGWDAARLLQEADKSMYCAKRGARMLAPAGSGASGAAPRDGDA